MCEGWLILCGYLLVLVDIGLYNVEVIGLYCVEVS